MLIAIVGFTFFYIFSSILKMLNIRKVHRRIYKACIWMICLGTIGVPKCECTTSILYSTISYLTNAFNSLTIWIVYIANSIKLQFIYKLAAFINENTGTSGFIQVIVVDILLLIYIILKKCYILHIINKSCAMERMIQIFRHNLSSYIINNLLQDHAPNNLVLLRIHIEKCWYYLEQRILLLLTLSR